MSIIDNVVFSSALLLCSMALQAEDTSEYLGLFTPTDTSYQVGQGEDAFDMKRTMTSCAKNKGFLQALVPIEGVHPVTEIEILHALNDKESILVDMRMEDSFFKETIPLAVNIPYTEVELRLGELGCKKDQDRWDCSQALKVYAFCNGPVCTQSPVGIRTMVRSGFPADKIYYYRGGMLVWTALGLNTVAGEF